MELVYSQDGFFRKSGREPLHGYSDFAWVRIVIELDTINQVICTGSV